MPKKTRQPAFPAELPPGEGFQIEHGKYSFVLYHMPAQSGAFVLFTDKTLFTDMQVQLELAKDVLFSTSEDEGGMAVVLYRVPQTSENLIKIVRKALDKYDEWKGVAEAVLQDPVSPDDSLLN